MSIEAGRAYFRQFGMEDRVQEFTVSSATVDLAAKALGVEGARIAKTLSFKTADGCMLILAAGDARIDNHKFKEKFHMKAKMLSADEVLELVADVDFSVNVISKSGTTTEPALAFRVLRGMMERRYGKEAAGRLYDRSYLEHKDKYSSFLGGNQPLCVLENPAITDGSKLLLIRDSYSDSLAPFLAQRFSEVHLVDLRYYHTSVADYMAEQGIDTTVVLYSVSNFITDRNLIYLAPRG